MIHPVDNNFLTLRLQVKPEGMERLTPLYEQYRRAHYLIQGTIQPLPQIELLHIACQSFALDMPEEAQKPIPLPRPIVAVKVPVESNGNGNGHAIRPTGLLETLRQEPANRLLNYFTEKGVFPARLVKVATTGKVKIRATVDDKEKHFWVDPDPSQIQLADLSPVVYRNPENVGGAKTFELQ